MSVQDSTRKASKGELTVQSRPQPSPPTAEPPTGGNSGSPLTRVTVNLTPRSVTALDSAVARTGDSRTDTINRALQVYDLVLELLERGDGRSLRLKHPDGEVERIFIT
jgi:hypothetical protein